MLMVYIKCHKNRLHISKFEMRGGEQQQRGTEGSYLSPYFRKRYGLKPD